MHYEDLTIIELNNTENFWYAKLVSKNGGVFLFPVANSNVTEEELSQNDVVIGKIFLGSVVNDRLVALDGFTFIESKLKCR